MDQNEEHRIEVEERSARPAQDDEYHCAQCGAPLRTACEQCATLCSWCEESRAEVE